MVGYLKPNFKNMPVEQKKEYKSFYCGLCKSLKRQYGYIGISSLNYEMTAFLILLSGLEKEKNEVFHGSCTISPFVPVVYVDYFQVNFICAAHLSILITHYGIKDNLIDEGGLKWRILDKITRKISIKSIDKLHNDYYKMDESVSLYYDIEKNGEADFNEVLKANGKIIETILSPLIKSYDVETTKLLLELANCLGRWIYLVDACDDFNNDLENGSFNPLLLIDYIDNISGVIKFLELDILRCIKKLPLLNYRNLIHYIFVANLEFTKKKVFSKLFGSDIDFA